MVPGVRVCACVFSTCIWTHTSVCAMFGCVCCLLVIFIAEGARIWGKTREFKSLKNNMVYTLFKFSMFHFVSIL